MRAPLVKRFTVITLFPELVEAFKAAGVVGRASQRGLFDIATINPRNFSDDRRGTVDDSPYGGGPGMVMTVAPLRAAIRRAREFDAISTEVIYLSPQGRRFSQRDVPLFAPIEHLVLVAGRYEGIDERVIERDVDSEWSLGDFVVSGGELPALMMIDAIARTLPGVLGDDRSAREDSFCDDLLDHPHYTRPENADGDRVPAVLMSGDHAAIARWRRKQQLVRTIQRRPDLLDESALEAGDRQLLEENRQEQDRSTPE